MAARMMRTSLATRQSPVASRNSCKICKICCNATPQKPKEVSTSGFDTFRFQIAPKVLSLAAAALVSFSPAVMPASANERVAEFAASGFIPLPGVFQDTIQVFELSDPGVDGVTLYYTEYSRSLSEKLSSDPFADPSQSSVSCVATGPVIVKDPVSAKGSGVEILSELKTFNLLQNKRLRVRRLYDEERGTVIYVSYSTRFTSTAEEGGVSSSRYRSSICALPVSSPPTAPTP